MDRTNLKGKRGQCKEFLACRVSVTSVRRNGNHEWSGLRVQRNMFCRTVAVFAVLWALLPAGVSSFALAVAAAEGVSFELDVQPILTARGCNSGPCHGKARGQNGFQLSLLGFDPDFDYAALTTQARGRRVFPADPPRSLVLLKGTAQLPHGGGVRLNATGEDHATLVRWIAAGMPRSLPGEPRLEQIAVSLPQRILAAGETDRLQVTASYSDGSTRDVTRWAKFQSSDSPIVSIDEEGRFRADPFPAKRR